MSAATPIPYHPSVEQPRTDEAAIHAQMLATFAKIDHRPSVGPDGIGGRPRVTQVPVGMRVRLERGVAPNLQEQLLVAPEWQVGGRLAPGVDPGR